MGAIRYSCPIRPVPTYRLPAKEIRLLGKFQNDSFKTERLVCVETALKIEDFWESFSPIALKLLWESFSPIALKLREVSSR